MCLVSGEKIHKELDELLSAIVLRCHISLLCVKQTSTNCIELTIVWLCVTAVWHNPYCDVSTHIVGKL